MKTAGRAGYHVLARTRVRQQRRRHLHIPISEQTRTRFGGHTLVVFYEMAWMAVSVDTHTEVTCARTHSTLCGRSHVHFAATPPHTRMLMLCSCMCTQIVPHVHASARNVNEYR